VHRVRAGPSLIPKREFQDGLEFLAQLLVESLLSVWRQETLSAFAHRLFGRLRVFAVEVKVVILPLCYPSLPARPPFGTQIVHVFVGFFRSGLGSSLGR